MTDGRPQALPPAGKVTGPQRAVVLLELGEHGPLSVGALAARCRLPDDVVTQHLLDLARAGYAEHVDHRWRAVPLLERHRLRSRPLPAHR